VPATTEAIELTRLAAEAAASKKGSDLVAFDVSEQLGITDVFLIVSATNERQVGAVVDAVEERLLGLSSKPLRREGGRENRWVLLDYGDVVVHVQHTDERHLYALERLWRDCPRISLDGIESAPADDDEDGPMPGLLAGERPGR
jgi:ribosome-associated protein